jgi:hypothetical protein
MGATVSGIVADHDVIGQFRVLLRILEGRTWGEVWDYFGLTVQSFRTLGLSRDTQDAVLWQVCQERRLVLLTANRRDDRPDSLERVIRSMGTSKSLPVFTLANPKRLSRSPAHAHKVVERLLEYLLDIENYLGSGRLYLP